LQRRYQMKLFKLRKISNPDINVNLTPGRKSWRTRSFRCYRAARLPAEESQGGF
jgi:hypothetical protein